MGNLNHAQIRDIEQFFIENDPYAIPDDEEVIDDGQQETPYAEKSSSAASD